LVFKAAIDGYDYVKLRCLGCSEKFTVFESPQSSIPRGLAFLSLEMVPELLVHTLTE